MGAFVDWFRGLKDTPGTPSEAQQIQPSWLLKGAYSPSQTDIVQRNNQSPEAYPGSGSVIEYGFPKQGGQNAADGPVGGGSGLFRPWECTITDVGTPGSPVYNVTVYANSFIYAGVGSFTVVSPTITGLGTGIALSVGDYVWVAATYTTGTLSGLAITTGSALPSRITVNTGTRKQLTWALLLGKFIAAGSFRQDISHQVTMKSECLTIPVEYPS